MANKRVRTAIEKVMKTEGEPMTTAEIIDRLKNTRYKNVPSVNSACQILTRDKRFVKIEFNAQRKQFTWTLKEELQ
jgi:hypothetical protein